eukprot:SAG11_NODE_110_length_16199_cov_18.081180_4_plen_141_part_00
MSHYSNYTWYRGIPGLTLVDRSKFKFSNSVPVVVEVEAGVICHYGCTLTLLSRDHQRRQMATAAQIFSDMESIILAGGAEMIGGVFCIMVDDKAWTVDLNSGRVMDGRPHGKTDCTFAMAEEVRIAAGRAQIESWTDGSD